MHEQQLEVVTVNPKGEPKASVIWMHGLGDDAYGFVDIVPQFNLPEELGVRFIFPHAPVRPVTLNGGMKMRAWFDIYELATDARQDDEGIYASQRAVEELIAAEIAAGIPSERIVIAGFSQGGAMALHCGLRYEKKLAGILGLSAFLPLADKLIVERNPANDKTPVFIAHGEYDDVVPIAWAKQSRDLLQSSGYMVEWASYPMPHSVCPDEITKVSSLLRKFLTL